MTTGPWRQLLHPLANALHRALRWPAMQKVQSFVLRFPNPPTQPLMQMAAEKVKTLFAIVEFHPSRLLRMQLKTEAFQDHPDTRLGLLAILRGATHHHKVVRVSHQGPQGGTVASPQDVEHMQVNVRQQGRDHSTLRRARHRRRDDAVFHYTRLEPLPQQLQYPSIRDAPGHQ